MRARYLHYYFVQSEFIRIWVRISLRLAGQGPARTGVVVDRKIFGFTSSGLRRVASAVRHPRHDIPLGGQYIMRDNPSAEAGKSCSPVS